MNQGWPLTLTILGDRPSGDRPDDTNRFRHMGRGHHVMTATCTHSQNLPMAFLEMH